MALATLSIDIVAKLASMQESLDKAYRENEKTAAKIEARWNDASKTLSEIGQSLGGYLSARALVDFTLRTNDAFDALNDLKDASGSSIENLSALEDIARRNGGSLDTASGALLKFNSALREADGKSDVSEVLRRLGLDAEELKRIDPAEALLKTATAFQTVADDGSRARGMYILFGKATKEVAAYMNDLAEAGQLVGTVTAEQAAQAEKFNKQLAALSTSANNAARALVSDLIPALSSYLEKVARLPKNQALLFAEGEADIAQTKYKSAVDTLVELQEVLKKDPGNRGIVGAIANLKRDIPELKKASEDAADKLRAMLPAPEPTAGGGRGFVNPPVVKPSLGEIKSGGAAPKVAAAKVVDFSGPVIPPELEAAIKALAATDTAKIAELRSQLEQLFSIQESGAGDPQRLGEAIKATQDQLSKLTTGIDQVGPEIPADMIRQRKEVATSLQNLLDNTGSGQQQKLRDMKAALDEFVTINGGSDQTAQAYKLIGDQMDYLAGKSASLGQMIEANLGSGIRAALKGDWEGLASIFENVLVDSISSDLEKLIKSQLGSLAGIGSGGGVLSLVGSLIGIPGFASGGTHSGGLRVVGENGPELEATGPSRIWNAAQTRQMLAGGSGSGGGSGSVVIDQTGLQINVGQGVSIGQVREAMRQTQAATLAAVQRAKMIRGD